MTALVTTTEREPEQERPDRVGSSLVMCLALVALGLVGGRFARRGAARGALAAVAASALARVAAAAARYPAATPRRHPGQWRLSGASDRRRRSLVPDPTTAASAAAAVGVAVESPIGGIAFASLTALLTAVRARSSTLPLGRVVSGGGIGVAAGLGSRWLWSGAPQSSADLRPARVPDGSKPSPTGRGLVVFVNPQAGSAFDGDVAGTVRQSLPDAQVVELEDGEDLEAALRRAADDGALALGMAGGDGSLNAAAGVAYQRELPLMAIPAGTLNHLARDLGLDTVDEAVQAVRQGDLTDVDLGEIDGRPFLNTASFGSYAELVDARERLEERLGKWPAMLVALVRVLRRSEPVFVELDGEELALWMIFIGNCRYQPDGFAPRRRVRLDDGQLDVRLVSAKQPGSRARLVLALLTGRLLRSRIYEQRYVSSLRVRS
ncbi:MAG: PA-phosphatase, partial [Actinomycetota bacterium]|nr:PA-phosphatase [Actinomycetota bacterium]